MTRAPWQEEERARIACERAEEWGRTAGHASGSEWYADGCPEEHRPEPDLSGEWAGTLTGPALYARAYAPHDPPGHGGDFVAVCEAYEEGFRAAVDAMRAEWRTCRACRGEGILTVLTGRGTVVRCSACSGDGIVAPED